MPCRKYACSSASAISRKLKKKKKKREREKKKEGLTSGSMTTSAIAPKGIGLGIFTGLDKANLHVAPDLKCAWP